MLTSGTVFATMSKSSEKRTSFKNQLYIFLFPGQVSGNKIYGGA
jgi:hypothetical protein